MFKNKRFYPNAFKKINKLNHIKPLITDTYNPYYPNF